MMRVLLVAVAAILAAALVGCAGEDISVTAGEELEAHVDALREAVAAGDREGAHGKLADLRAALAEYEEQGDVSAERAASIRETAAEVAELLALLEEPDGDVVASDEENADQENADEDAGSTEGGAGSTEGDVGSTDDAGDEEDRGSRGGGPQQTPPGHGGDPPGQGRGGGNG